MEKYRQVRYDSGAEIVRADDNIVYFTLPFKLHYLRRDLKRIFGRYVRWNHRDKVWILNLNAHYYDPSNRTATLTGLFHQYVKRNGFESVN